MASLPLPAPWRRVKWTRAAQLAEMADAVAVLSDLHDVPPPQAFGVLRTRDPQAATRFIAQCLPRFDAIHWLHRAVGRTPAPTPAHAEIRAAIAGWLTDPSDKRRRHAFDLAQAMGIDNADAVAGLALFLSGGSMTPPELDQGVQPPAGVFGEAVSGTILLAALARGPQYFDEELDALLGLALTIAEAEDVH